MALFASLKPKVLPILGLSKTQAMHRAASGDDVFASLHLSPFHYKAGLGLGERLDVWGRVLDFAGCGGCGGMYERIVTRDVYRIITYQQQTKDK